MPAKDLYHDVVKQALIKADWTITHDPFPLAWAKRNLSIDIGAEQLLAAAKQEHKIAGDCPMDFIENYRKLVQQLLTEYARIPTPNCKVQHETIFDTETDRYLLLAIGWSEKRRVHHCVMHIDIIDSQVWIQANNTDRLIAEELVSAGIPPELIVLGLQPPEVRPYTAYGIQQTKAHML